MKKGKRVLGIAVSVMIMFSIVFIIAEELEGELPTAFDATVGLTNAPPVIVAVYDIIDNDVQSGAGSNDVIPLAGGVNNAVITFLAQDSNGEEDLPGGTEGITESSSIGDIPATGNANIEVYVTSPDFSTQILTIGCVEDVACTLTGGCDSNQKEYSCIVPLQYYYEPGSNNWNIYVAVADMGDSVAFDNAKMFSYNPFPAFEVVAPIGGLSWTGVSLGGTNQLPTNAPLPLQLKNIGNVNYISGSVTGVNLAPGGGATGDDLPVDAFSVSTQTGGIPLAECNEGVSANALSTSSIPITLGGLPSLIYGNGAGAAPAAVGEELYFCLWDQLDQRALTFSEDTYSSSWDVDFSTS